MPTRAQRWQARCAHVLIDEYQDTNPAQYRLFRHLVGRRDAVHRRWRRRPGDLRLARRDARQSRARCRATIPDLRVIKLEQNYRSTVRILRCANALIGNNPKLFDKRLWTELAHGDPLRVTPAADEEAEAELVVRRSLATSSSIGTKFSRLRDPLSRQSPGARVRDRRCARNRSRTRSQADNRCSSAPRSRTSLPICA